MYSLKLETDVDARGFMRFTNPSPAAFWTAGGRRGPRPTEESTDQRCDSNNGGRPTVRAGRCISPYQCR